MSSDWPGEVIDVWPMQEKSRPRPGWPVQTWIAGTCGLMVAAAIFACWALAQGELLPSLLLVGATLGAASAMLLGIDHARCSNDDQEK